MKKTSWNRKVLALAVIGCSLIPFSGVSGEKASRRFVFEGSAGIGIPFSEPSATPVDVRFTGYYNLGARWFAGVGTGVSFYDGEALIPLFADAGFRITRSRKWTPVVQCGMGHAFALASDMKGGFCLSPSVGIHYALRENLKLRFSVGYEFQELQRLKRSSDGWFGYEFREQLKHHSLMVRVGIVF